MFVWAQRDERLRRLRHTARLEFMRQVSSETSSGNHSADTKYNFAAGNCTLSAADSLDSIRTSRVLLTGDMVLQWPLFKERWKTILFGAIFQYVHGIFTQLAHRMARPTAEPLHVRHPCLAVSHCVCNNWTRNRQNPH